MLNVECCMLNVEKYLYLLQISQKKKKKFNIIHASSIYSLFLIERTKNLFFAYHIHFNNSLERSILLAMYIIRYHPHMRRNQSPVS